MPKVRYVSFDPGETTGYATFDEEGLMITMGQFKQKDHTKEIQRLITSDLYKVIVEDYRNYFGQKRWARNQTSKNIGAIELLCGIHGVEVVLQPASILPIGLRYIGMEQLPSNHEISHQFSAAAHGVYWLRTNGIRKPTIPEEN